MRLIERQCRRHSDRCVVQVDPCFVLLTPVGSALPMPDATGEYWQRQPNDTLLKRNDALAHPAL